MIHWKLILSSLTLSPEIMSWILFALVIATILPWPIASNSAYSQFQGSHFINTISHFPSLLTLYTFPDFNDPPIPPRVSILEEKKHPSWWENQPRWPNFTVHFSSPLNLPHIYIIFSYFFLSPQTSNFSHPSLISGYNVSYLTEKKETKLRKFLSLPFTKSTCLHRWPFALASFLLQWKNSLAPIYPAFHLCTRCQVLLPT